MKPTQETTEIKPGLLKGNFLTAMPAMQDPNFAQSVTCIAQHNQQGAMGVIVSCQYDKLYADMIFKELKLEHVPKASKIPIYSGGPVHQDELFVIHGPPFDWLGTLRVSKGVALSNTIDILTAIAADRGPENFLITLGCAGWSAGQLEAELLQNAWLNSILDEEILFEWPVEKRWEETIRRMGIDPLLLSDMAGNA